jgi:SAM-dependent methyltransferase
MTGWPLWQRCIAKSHALLQRPLRCRKMAVALLEDKTGLEIGGPSQVFRQRLPCYACVGNLDNCDFSSRNAWSEHGDLFEFHAGKAPGRNIFCDASDLRIVPDDTYEFILSSHNLEHFANPVKALKEWQRVTVPGGILVLVLPNYCYTFDHRRQPTPVRHMLDDFEQNTPESDLTHLPDILANHDLRRDPLAGTPEEFKKRSLANFENRCLHHHVFSEKNTGELLGTLGMKLLALETAWPNNLFAIAQMP